MTKGITYTATDSKGTVHTRYSIGHKVPQYAFAVVRRPGNTDKTNVSYAGRLDLARSTLNTVRNVRYQSWAARRAAENGRQVGDCVYPDAEIVEVWATFGKIK